MGMGSCGGSPSPPPPSPSLVVETLMGKVMNIVMTTTTMKDVIGMEVIAVVIMLIQPTAQLVNVLTQPCHALVHVVILIIKVITTVMMKTTIVDAHGMGEIAVMKTHPMYIAHNVNVLTQVKLLDVNIFTTVNSLN